VLAVAVPGPALGAAGWGPATPAGDSYVTTSDPYVRAVGSSGATFKALINSGETAFGTLFEGIPDGIGVVPAPAPLGYVDLYVNHEQSRVPFGGFADFQDSSVTRVRVDVASQEIIAMDVALSPDEGLIRFCSSFMAGPDHGFPHYTLLTNEESNDPLIVPAGAVYGADPAYGGANIRQAGYSVWLDTANGKMDVLAGAGRHNHENQVIVPGGWNGIYSLSGDDTFTAPSSQLYLFSSKNWQSFLKDEGALWAFRVTATDEGPVTPTDPQNNANDYLEITPADAPWKGEFIPVPAAIARGTGTGASPQDALEAWSNENNVFQFVRVEDIDYDPDNPRVVYFADTGTDRLTESATTGRLFRGPPNTGTQSNGRIFRMTLNEDDPRIVDAFDIVADGNVGPAVGMRNPDNVALSANSIMVQEDVSNAQIWMYSFASDSWAKVAEATTSQPETTGIVDVSRWFGDGWWALDVQSHVNLAGSLPGQTYTHPVTGAQTVYTARRENGQLLLMRIPGS
jgi:hypothetical protein